MQPQVLVVPHEPQNISTILSDVFLVMLDRQYMYMCVDEDHVSCKSLWLLLLFEQKFSDLKLKTLQSPNYLVMRSANAHHWMPHENVTPKKRNE